MLSLLADENLNANIVRGVQRRFDGINVVRVQDVGLTGADAPTVLAWAAEHSRVLITQTVETVTRYALERVHGVRRCPVSWRSSRQPRLAEPGGGWHRFFLPANSV